MTSKCDDASGDTEQNTERYRLESGESPAMGVVRAVAAVSGRHPTGTNGATDALDPLAGSVDPEALDRIFGSRDGPATDAVVEFDYCGRRVTVAGGETVCVAVE